ncbi:MAG: WYL domain-containing protein, partial [Anaerovoracaceae bacterium]
PHNEKYRVTVNVMDSEGLYYWLLQYEKNVKVIAPTGVRAKLIDKAKGILDLYKEGIIND